MTKLTLQHYLTANRPPAKILCIDEKVSYRRIPLPYAFLPMASHFVVDHVERDLLSPGNDVVYVRFDVDPKGGDE